MLKEKWDSEKIESSLKQMIQKTGQSYMPTHSEMIEFFGNNKLCNAVRRHGGTKYWAEKIGFAQKQCESKTGSDYEQIFCNQVIEKFNVDAQLTPIRYPYDVLVDGSVKVDVKSGCTVGSGSKYYSFNLEKALQTCDIFAVYCLDENMNQAKMYIIPASVLSGKTQLAFGILKTKYSIYENRWDILNEFISLGKKYKPE